MHAIVKISSISYVSSVKHFFTHIVYFDSCYNIDKCVILLFRVIFVVVSMNSV